MQFKKRRELKRTKIEIIPMIDTIFFLLVFFMLSSLSMRKMNGLPVNLPDAKTAPRQSPTELTVTLTSDGQLLVNQQVTTWRAYQRTLTQSVGDIRNATLTINADERVPHGSVVRAIDYARDLGITRYAIATQQKSTP
ncbi:MAG TPA: biopolymer transporter ExbD [Abditibacteriaceae bacterium]|jgi:biopolymer transport protein ExbD